MRRVTVGQRSLASLFSVGTIMFSASSLYAQQSVVFEGVPVRSVVVSPYGVEDAAIAPVSQLESQVQIVEVSGRYFWASREMKELALSRSGLYVTFHAVDGTGYVRVFAPALVPEPQSNTARDPSGPEYMEHLLLTLGSITYYGLRK